MTVGAQRNEVVFLVFARMAAKLLMMNFEISHRTAELASPAIPSQHLFTEFGIVIYSEPKRSRFYAGLIHGAGAFTIAANACCCSPGRN